MMPPRRIRGQYLDVDMSGPLFEGDPGVSLYRALGQGIQAMGELGAEILTQHVYAAGLVDTGAMIGSIESEYRQEKGSGYATIRALEVYPKDDRPTKTWIERGTRRGAKMRKADRVIQKSKTRLRQQPLANFFDARVEQALN